MKRKKVDKLMHLHSYTAILLIYVVGFDSIYLTWKIRPDSYLALMLDLSLLPVSSILEDGEF